MTARIITILGEAGSGKDTVADMLAKQLPTEPIAFADPFKHFCKAVFGFSDDQLWGPSASRNAPDPSLSYSFARPTGFGRVAYEVKRIFGKTPKLLSREEIEHNRLLCEYHFHAQKKDFIEAVLPKGVPQGTAYSLLQLWLNDVLKQKDIAPRYPLQTIGSEWGRALDPNIWIDLGFKRAHAAAARGNFAIIKDVRFINEAQRSVDEDAVLLFIDRPVDKSAIEAAGVKGHQSEQQQRSPEMQALVKKHGVVIPNTGTLEDLNGCVTRLCDVLRVA